MKQFMMVLLVVLGVMGSVFAAYQKPYTYEIVGGQAQVTKIDDVTGTLVVPATLGVYPVDWVSTESDGLFNGLRISTLDIKEGVSAFPLGAVEECTSIAKIILPATLTDIGDTFDGNWKCDKLATYSVAVGNAVFSSQDGILFDKNKTYLIAYPRGNSRTSYTVPSTVETIEADAFDGLMYLATLNLSARLSRIEEYSSPSYLYPYVSGVKLTAINVPTQNLFFASQDGVLFNKDKTRLYFYPSAKAAAIYTVPETVTNIYCEAFNNTLGLGKIVLSSNTRFSGYRNPIGEELSSGYTDVVWALGKKLTDVVVPEANPYYASVDGVLFNKDKTTLMVYPAANPRTSYKMPDSVFQLFDSAFSGGANLKNLTLSSSLGQVWWAETMIDSLENIHVPEENPNYTSIDGVLFNKDVTELCLYPCGNPRTSYVVPSSASSETFNLYPTYAMFGKKSPLQMLYIGPNVTRLNLNFDSSSCSLTKIYFSGNCPVLDGWFAGKMPTLYVLQGASGWPTPPAKYESNNGNEFPVAYWTGVGTSPQCAVTLNANGGTIAAASAKVTMALGNPVGELPNPNLRAGYAFVGWTTDKVGVTAVISSEVPMSLPAVTLYAQWVKTWNLLSDNKGTYISDGTWKIYYTLLDGGLKLISCASGTGVLDLSRPIYQNGEPSALQITAIGESAFAKQTKITSVVFPASVQTVGEYAFTGCTGLTAATLSACYAPVSAFSGCSKLAGFTVPTGVGLVVDSSTGAVYDELGRLLLWPGAKTAVVLKAGATRVDDNLFAGSGITAVTIPDSVSEIGAAAFAGCVKLTSVKFENPQSGSVPLAVYSNAFENCTGLKTIVLPSRLISLGYRTFAGSGLTSVDVPAVDMTSGMPAVGGWVFADCKALTTASISADAIIPEGIFAGCGKLSSISLKSGTFQRYEVVNGKALYDNQSMYGKTLLAYAGASTTFTIATNTQRIGAGAFSGCVKLVSLTLPGSSGLTDPGIVSVGDFAFASCSALTALTIPAEVQQVGAGIAQGSQKLLAITLSDPVGAVSGNYCVRSGVLYKKEGDSYHLTAFPGGLTKLTVPEDTSKIGDYAFAGSKLASVSLPFGLSEIGAGAFERCTSLTSLTVPASVFSMGGYGISGATASFRGCTALKTIYYLGNAPIVADLYAGTPAALTSYVLPNSTSWSSASQGGTNLPALWPESTTGNLCEGRPIKQVASKFTLTYNAQSGTVKPASTNITLASVGQVFGQLPVPVRANYEFLGWYTAINGAGLKIADGTGSAVEMPINATVNQTLYANWVRMWTYDSAAGTITDGNWKLTVEEGLDNGLTVRSVVSGSGVLDFTGPVYSFAGGVKTATYLVREIGEEAFVKNAKVTSVVLPNSVNTIAGSAFEDCSALVGVVFGNQVQTIGAWAFSGCPKLEKLSVNPSGESTAYLSVRDGVLFSADAQTLILYPNVRKVDGKIPTAYVVPATVVQIGSTAFSGCSNLKQITIPAALQSLGLGAFSECANLEAFAVSGSSGLYAEDGILFAVKGEGRELIVYPNARKINGKQATAYAIPATVTAIADGAFADCTKLSVLTFAAPSQVKSIGHFAFTGCSLATVTIPASVERMGAAVFSECKTLKTVYYLGNGPTAVDETGFEGFYERTPTTLVSYVLKNTTGWPVVPGRWPEGDAADRSLQYSTVKFVLTFDGQGGTSTQKTASVTYDTLGQTYGTLPVPKRANYKFLGWYTQPNGGGSQVTEEDVLAGTVNQTLYANWVRKWTLTSRLIDTGSGMWMQPVITDGNWSLLLSSVDSYSAQAESALDMGGDVIQVESYLSGSGVLDLTGPVYVEGSEEEGAELAITAIGSEAFRNCKSLTSVLLPDTVFQIGCSAFEGCAALVSAALGSGLNPEYGGIGTWTFAGCPKLETVKVSEDSEFYRVRDGILYCSAETNEYGTLVFYPPGRKVNGKVPTGFTIPEDVVVLADTAFAGAVNLKQIVLSENLMTLGDGVFAGCSALESISIPPNGYSAEWLAVSNGVLFAASESGKVLAAYPNMRKVGTVLPASYTIPVDTVAIGAGAFEGSTKLTSVVFASPSQTIEIWQRAFYGCQFASFELPDSLSSLGQRAFENCAKLKSVNLKPAAGLYAIDAKTFRSCSALTAIEIPASVYQIGSEAFSGCSALASVTFEEDSQLVYMDGYAFENCIKLTQIHLPRGLFGVNPQVFSGCTGLKTVTVESGNLYLYASGGVVYSREYGDLVFCPPAYAGELVVPEGIYSVDAWRLSDCSKVTSLVLPASLESFSAGFENCPALKAIKVVSANQNYKSVDGVLYMRDGMELVSVPPAATSVSILPTAEAIGYQAFCGCSALTKIAIPDKILGVGGYAFRGCTKLSEVTLGAGIQGLESTAFYGCSALKSVYYRSGVPPEVDSWDGTSVYYTTPSSLVSYVPRGSDGWRAYVEESKSWQERGIVWDVALTYDDPKAVEPFICVPEYFQDSPGYVGVPFAASIMGFDPETMAFSASGLPAGLKLVQDSDTGELQLSGTPTAAGVYTSVKIVLKDRLSKSYVTVAPVVSIGTLSEVAGTYNGCFMDGDRILGTLTMTIGANGSVSAKAVVPDGTITFSGKSWNNMPLEVSLTTAKGDTFIAGFDLMSTEDSVGCYLMTAAGNAYDGSLVKNAFSDKTSPDYPSASARMAQLAGTYNVIAGDEMMEAGYAYSVMVLKADGTVTYSGKGPDGTTTSGSGVAVIVRDFHGEQTLIPFFTPMNSGKGFVSLCPRIETDGSVSSGDFAIVSVWDWIAAPEDATVLNELQGSRYVSTLDLASACRSALLQLPNGMSVPIVEKNGTLALDSGYAAEAGLAGFTFAKATGIFKASWTSAEYTGGVAKPVEGILTPSASMEPDTLLGGGYVLVGEDTSLPVRIVRGDGSIKVGTDKLMGDLGAWLSSAAEDGAPVSGLKTLNGQFTAATQQSSTDYAAILGKVLTSLAVLADDADLNSLLQSFGITPDFETLTFDGEPDFSAAPQVNAAVDRIVAKVEPLLKAALTDLGKIPAGWTGSVVLDTETFPVDETVYVDKADVLMFKAFINTVLGVIKVAGAYDLTADYDKAFEDSLPLVSAPITVDGNESDWDDVPLTAWPMGWNGYIRYCKTAQHDGKIFCLLKLDDESLPVDWVSLNVYGGAGGQYTWSGPFSSEEPVFNQDEYSDTFAMGALIRNGGVIECEINLLEWQSIADFRDSTSLSIGGGEESNGWWYDSLDVDYEKPITALLADHPNFLSSVRSTSSLTAALAYLKTSLVLGLQADAAVTNRTDANLHFVEYGSTADRDSVLAELSKLQKSLNGQVQTFTFGDVEADLKLSAVFGSPYVTRALLPEISGESFYVDTLKDPTFAGVLPGMTKALWWDLTYHDYTGQDVVFVNNVVSSVGSSNAPWKKQLDGSVQIAWGSEEWNDENESELRATVTGSGTFTFTVNAADLENHLVDRWDSEYTATADPDWLTVLVNGVPQVVVRESGTSQISVPLTSGSNSVVFRLVKAWSGYDYNWLRVPKEPSITLSGFTKQ